MKRGLMEPDPDNALSPGLAARIVLWSIVLTLILLIVAARFG